MALMSLTENLLTAISTFLIFWYLSSRSDNAIYGKFSRVTGPAILAFFPPPVHDLVKNGYEEITKTSGKPYVVRWWAKDYLLLPPKYLADLRGADWKALSFFTNISDALFLHTSVGDLYQSDRMVQVVKRGLNPHLPRLTTTVVPPEADLAILKEIGQPREWKSVPATKTMIAIAHRIATRLMVCEESSRDELFITRSIAFVESLFGTALSIVYLPLGFLRDLLAYPLSMLHRWKLKKASDLLRPVVEARMRERASGHDTSHYDDAIEWTLANSPDGAQNESPQRITEELLHGLWAGSSAPGGLLTDLIFQVLLMPQYLEPLRKEAETAFDQFGWTESLFGALRLQDSFIREVTRMYPTGAIGCSRTVKDAPFRFSDGLTLPVGTRFAFPIKAMQSDPAILQEELAFDGFRFAKREEEDSENKRWTASSADVTNLAFGYGNHVCPGRFYAIRQVKVLFTKLLLSYEFKWDGNVNERPQPIFVEGQFVPNMKQRICFRLRAQE